MIELSNIHKAYRVSDESVTALNGVSVKFEEKGLVSIVGPSGCGKTTLLNVIGGLDQYDEGDILIDGVSTKSYKDTDWDAYRNHRIGFVFQSYNLIPHLNVLDNVTMALSLSGIGERERKQRATKMLQEVGLGDKLKKKLSQLSGGQQQRVAIARALVNSPDILLADEPTGALDSKTSTQIMELLSEIAKTRLVIMVTHNLDIASSYSDRVIEMLDGQVQSDSKPFNEEVSVKPEENKKQKGTSMSFFEALKSSGKNLLTKKGRTIATSIAGSIGIIGIGLVLSLSNGISQKVSAMEGDSLAGFPISIPSTTMTASSFFGNGDRSQYPSSDEYYARDTQRTSSQHKNDFSSEFLDYLGKLNPKTYNSIVYGHGVALNVIYQNGNNYGKVPSGSDNMLASLGLGNSLFSEVPDYKDFILSQYDILAGDYPTEANQLGLVVNTYNQLDDTALSSMGFAVQETYTSADFLGKEYQVLGNDDFYQENDGVYAARTDYENLYNLSGTTSLKAKITCILRQKPTSSSSFLSEGLLYTSKLTDKLLNDGAASRIALAQKATPETNVLTGQAFNRLTSYEANMLSFGADKTPTSISIYPKSFDDKAKIKAYIDEYNRTRTYDESIIYTDLAESITSVLSMVTNAITVVLSAIAAISLVVSSVMIAIIIYVSVIERTKEIGIMRALGARKKDIKRIFSMEAITIGAVAGVIGVLVTYILDIPISLLVGHLVEGSFSAFLAPQFALLLLAVSILLTFIAGIAPSAGASRKDPVIALRDN